ncbi:MAG: Bbp16 family capsid cement protein [Bdellovibrionales bacterium]
MRHVIIFFSFLFATLFGNMAFASWDQNSADHLSVLNLLPVASVTASGNATGVDMQAYHGQVAIVADVANTAGATPTMDLKIQDSADNSSFADVSPAIAFTQVTTVASVQKLVVNVQEIRRYIRVVKTIGGTSTPTYLISVKGYATKRQLP